MTRSRDLCAIAARPPGRSGPLAGDGRIRVIADCAIADGASAKGPNADTPNPARWPSPSRLRSPSRSRSPARLAASLRGLALCVPALAALCGCRGPTLAIESSHPVFVDGLQRDLRAPLPFRYYGDVLVDTVPGDVEGRPDWTKQPSRTEIHVARRTPAYLFPLDLPLDLLLWSFTGPGDRAVAVEPQAAPQQVALGFQPEGLEPLRSRAFAARSER